MEFSTWVPYTLYCWQLLMLCVLNLFMRFSIFSLAFFVFGLIKLLLLIGLGWRCYVIGLIGFQHINLDVEVLSSQILNALIHGGLKLNPTCLVHYPQLGFYQGVAGQRE